MATQYHQPQFIRSDNGNLEKVVYRNPLSSDEKDSLSIERRKFFSNSHCTLFTDKYTEVPPTHAYTCISHGLRYSVTS